MFDFMRRNSQGSELSDKALQQSSCYIKQEQNHLWMCCVDPDTGQGKNEWPSVFICYLPCIWDQDGWYPSWHVLMYQ